MKWKIEFEGDFYDDRSTLKEIALFREATLAIYSAMELIRSRMKWYQWPLTAEECKAKEELFLEELRSTLYLSHLED